MASLKGPQTRGAELEKQKSLPREEKGGSQKEYMNKTEKDALIQTLHAEFKSVQSAVVTQNLGMPVAEVTKLRREIRASSGRFKVVKNTLARRAVKGTGMEAIGDSLVGPTGISYSSVDPVAHLKAVVKAAKADGAKVKIVAGVFEGKLLSLAEVEALSNMPPKEELIAKMLGSLNAPATNLALALKDAGGKLVRVIESVRKQKEAAGA